MNTVTYPDRLHEPAFPASRASQGSLVKDFLIIGVLFFVNRIGLPGNLVFFGILAFMINRSIEDAVKAASLLFLVSVGNTVFVSTGSIVFSAGKQLFLIALCARVLLELGRGARPRRAFTVIATLCLFSMVAFLLAVQGWRLVHISALKLVAFTSGVTFVILASELLRSRRHRLDRWFVAMAMFIALLALGSYVLGVGYNARANFSASLFNGPFFHSQTFGPACAMIGLYLLSYVLFHKREYRAISMLLIPAFAVFLYMSSARTALLAGAMAVIAALGIYCFLSSTVVSQLAKFVRVTIVAIILGFVALVAIETIAPGAAVEPLLEFITKGRENALGGIQEIASSRESLVTRLMTDINNNPITGIGFGTDTSIYFQENVSLFSAPMEKGVLPLAVLQENGIVGAIFFAIFMLAFLFYLIRGGYVSGILLVSAFLGINFAEMTFFSFGGSGGIYWIWILASLCLVKPANSARVPTRQRAPVQITGSRVTI